MVLHSLTWNYTNEKVDILKEHVWLLRTNLQSYLLVYQEESLDVMEQNVLILSIELKIVDPLYHVFHPSFEIILKNCLEMVFAICYFLQETVWGENYAGCLDINNILGLLCQWNFPVTVWQVQFFETLLPSISCSWDYRWGIADWIGTVLECGIRRSTVKSRFFNSSFVTARAGMARSEEGFF